MRGPHELAGPITRLEDFDEIYRLMHSTEATVSCDCCSIIKLNPHIPNLALLFVQTTLDLLELFIQLLKASTHLLLHLFRQSIRLRPYFVKLRRNKFTLTK